jgi:hypothetical protein
MAKKNKKLDTAVKVTQASKFFSFTDGELAEAQSVIAKDEEKKKKAILAEEKKKSKEEERIHLEEVKKRQAEELDRLFPS